MNNHTQEQQEPKKSVSDQLLVDFLNADLDLGFTFCEAARIKDGLNPDGLEQAKEKIRKVISTVEHFLPRIRGEAERYTIQARLEELESVFLAYIDPLAAQALSIQSLNLSTIK